MNERDMMRKIYRMRQALNASSPDSEGFESNRAAFYDPIKSDKSAQRKGRSVDKADRLFPLSADVDSPKETLRAFDRVAHHYAVCVAQSPYCRGLVAAALRFRHAAPNVRAAVSVARYFPVGLCLRGRVPARASRAEYSTVRASSRGVSLAP